MKSAVTISVVEQAKAGPFVFHDDIAEGCRKAAELGFDAVELFTPGPQALEGIDLKSLLDQHGLALAAVGTGAGMVIHGLNLCDPSANKRAEAVAFIKKIVDMGAPFGAPAILGSMQGRWGGDVDKETALGYLRAGLNEIGAYAAEQGVPFIYEPLNRYETNLINTVADGVAMMESLGTDNVTLLADLFHMNIEEADLAAAIKTGGKHIGHIHFVDSQRSPAGLGHMEYEPIIAALKEIGYEGYLCAEAFPHPDSDAAARQTIDMFKKLVG
jgi:sugar phosphate isomerase/epimerase